MTHGSFNIQTVADDFRGRVDVRLQELINSEGENNRLAEVMRYAVLAPGKRLRPLICMLTAECLDGTADKAVDPACAIELIHTASLIVDDLPCMDDAEMRRGLLSCHRRFGEANTMLVALELLSLGYRVMSEAPELADTQRNLLVGTLARAVGMNGLIGGQERDLAAEKDNTSGMADSSQVTRIHELKTGALFVAAAEAGGIVAGLEGDQLLPIREFAARLGLAYQTFDDLIDAHATSLQAGKDVRQDVDKPTLVGMLGSAGANDYAHNMINAAISALQPLGPNMQPLENLVESLISRPESIDKTLN